jgi:ligand-binding sensor domain-containing protein
MAGSLVDPNPIFSKNGISCLDLRQQTWNYYEPLYIHQLASDRINELAFRDNLLWIGTDQGLSIYNLRKDSWKRFSMTQGLSDEVVNSIAVTDTVAWIGTPLGLSSVSIPKFKITRFRFAPDNFLLRIHKVFATTENIWIGTDNGLYSIHRINKRVRHFDMFGKEVGLSEPVAANILSITGLDSTLFFVSEKTVLTYNPITKLWNLLPELSFLNTVNVYDLKTEGDNLWFATDKGAYLVRISDLYYEHYKICDGLAGERVFRIVIDDDWVWFATDQGLTKYAWRQYVQKFE